MSVPENEVERRVSEFGAALRASGLRLTHQRLEVAREIAGSEAHPDTETVYCRVRTRVPTISIDTVYRTLAALEGLGLVQRVDVNAGPTRYDPNLDEHHHFICNRCGLVRDVYHTVFDGLEAPDLGEEMGRVETVRIQLRGVCKECLEAAGPSREMREPQAKESQND